MKNVRTPQGGGEIFLTHTVDLMSDWHGAPLKEPALLDC